jgi:hypothetical protein
LKLEFAGAAGQYLGEEHLTLSGNGVNVNVRCKGPWILMKVPPGSYSGHATVTGGSKSFTVNVSGRGQTRLVVSFPNTGGSVTPEGAAQNMGTQ